MKIVSSPTLNVRIWITGDVNKIRDVCRRWCTMKGACVTVTPTEYIYTGGAETGAVVGFINYPRFPTNETTLVNKAHELALLLIRRCNQLSCTVEGPTTTVFFSRREETEDKIKSSIREKT